MGPGLFLRSQIFSLRTAPRDHQPINEANRQPPTAANRQPPTPTNHELPTTNRRQPPPLWAQKGRERHSRERQMRRQRDTESERGREGPVVSGVGRAGGVSGTALHVPSGLRHVVPHAANAGTVRGVPLGPPPSSRPLKRQTVLGPLQDEVGVLRKRGQGVEEGDGSVQLLGVHLRCGRYGCDVGGGGASVSDDTSFGRDIVQV